MADTTGKLNIGFNVNAIDIVATPITSAVYNQFDDFGLLLGLDRLPGESSVSYKQRLMDVFAHRANSTYLGMIYGMTRELGLSLFKPFRLRPTVSGSTFIAADPQFNFNGPFLELWRDKANNILEMEIDIFNQSGPAYTILELYNYINANSTYFVADQLNTSFQYMRSMTIINQTNVEINIIEPMPPSTIFTLQNPGTDSGSILLDSLIFTDASTFSNKVSTPASVVSPGDYSIDPYTGIVNTFSEPSLGSIVKYKYIRYLKSYLIASPVIICNLQNSNMNRVIFDQKLADDGKYYDGVPNEFGADIINELLSVYPLTYGD